jgi:hypothetical protein
LFSSLDDERRLEACGVERCDRACVGWLAAKMIIGASAGGWHGSGNVRWMWSRPGRKKIIAGMMIGNLREKANDGCGAAGETNGAGKKHIQSRSIEQSRRVASSRADVCACVRVAA